MAVYLESDFFKFVVISDKSQPSNNNTHFSEKPPKDKPKDKEQKDNNMSTSSSSPPPNIEKVDEKKQNSQEAEKLPEVKIDDIPNNGDSTKEQKNEEKSSRLTIDVPSKSASPQLVTSPNEIRAKTPEPVSPSSNIFKNVGKKLGNMMRNPENGSTSDQVEVDSKNQLQQVQQVQQVENNTVAHDNITKNTVDTERSLDENKKKDDDEYKKKDEDMKKDEDKKKDENKKVAPEPTAAKQRTGSLPNLINMKMFITRTSSLVVDKLRKEFDNLDRRMYPDMEPEWVEENRNKLSREAAISEREQLLENKDVEITNGKTQSPQSTQNIMAEVGEALNERQERLNSLGEKTEELNNHAAGFAELAAQIKKNQEQKNKSWFW